MPKLKGEFDEQGRKRTQGKCAICGQRVWWCLAPPAPYICLPFEDNGDHHWHKCGQDIPDRIERIFRMVSDKMAEEYLRCNPCSPAPAVCKGGQHVALSDLRQPL
jgi:hypothetical protein